MIVRIPSPWIAFVIYFRREYAEKNNYAPGAQKLRSLEPWSLLVIRVDISHRPHYMYQYGSVLRSHAWLTSGFRLVSSLVFSRGGSILQPCAVVSRSQEIEFVEPGISTLILRSSPGTFVFLAHMPAPNARRLPWRLRGSSYQADFTPVYLLRCGLPFQQGGFIWIGHSLYVKLVPVSYV